MILLRQARDKHRENSKKERFLIRVAPLMEKDEDGNVELVRETPVFAPFYTECKNDNQFTNTRSGQLGTAQNGRNVEGKCAFSAGVRSDPGRACDLRPSAGAKNAFFFEPFLYRTDHFAKTGSGQT